MMYNYHIFAIEEVGYIILYLTGLYHTGLYFSAVYYLTAGEPNLINIHGL